MADAPLYELVNPSDAYTFRADKHEVAALVSLLLGNGMTPAKPVEEGKGLDVPMLLGPGATAWFTKTFGRSLEDALVAEAEAVAAALDSLWIGRPAERLELEKALALMPDPKARRKYLEERHERQRTSMNNIGKAAWHYAERIRELHHKGELKAKETAA
jgi:hypothetical protein